MERNCDVFDKEVADGLSCLAFGAFPAVGAPTVLAGGNCSITGFDLAGEERFWTVTGDNATSMEFLDWDEDGDAELVAASEDLSVRVFRHEEILADLHEQAKVLFVRAVRGCVFAFALANGAFGVYHGKKRLWRQKAKDRVTALVGADFDLEGQALLAVGFANGNVEVRKHRLGELVARVNLGQAAVAQLFYYDFRQEGQP